MKVFVCLALLTAARLAAAPQTEPAYISFDLDANVEVVVKAGDRVLKPNAVHAVPPGPLVLTLRYHDGEQWCEENLTVEAREGLLATFTLTARIHLKSWLV